jgi:hypothetical protein
MNDFGFLSVDGPSTAVEQAVLERWTGGQGGQGGKRTRRLQVPRRQLARLSGFDSKELAQFGMTKRGRGRTGATPHDVRLQSDPR